MEGDPTMCIDYLKIDHSMGCMMENAIYLWLVSRDFDGQNMNNSVIEKKKFNFGVLHCLFRQMVK